MSEKTAAEILSDGKILLQFKERYLSEQTNENLVAVLMCLRDSTLYVPLNMKMSDRDEEKFKDVKKGDIVTCEDEIHFSPDVFKTEDGAQFFPVFSTPEEMNEEYRKCFSVMPFGIFECLDMAHKIDGLTGIVLDAMTKPLPLVFEIADIIEKLPSVLEGGENG